MSTLLFTQTMHSLLSSSMPLQSALSVCAEILQGKKERRTLETVLRKVNEGKRLSEVLSSLGGTFPPLYISLVSIGEGSGTLPEVFGRLSEYLKNKKNLRQKILQALAYPALVLATACAVVAVLLVLVMPRLEGIFTAFTESSENIGQQAARIKFHFLAAAAIMLVLAMAALLSAVLYKTSKKAAFLMDSIVLKIPLLGRIIMTMQMHDFSFAMKLLSATYFPFVPSLRQAENVLSNRKLKKAVEQACGEIADGESAGDAFEKQKVFPKYLTVWIRIAERNGNTAAAFCQVCDYYSAGSENILADITAFAEPVFILLTGLVVIAAIGEFVAPVFNLLGEL